MKGAAMAEHKKITLPKTMPLPERISGVSKEISKWLESLKVPYNIDTDVMQLAKCERNDKYSYHYVIDRAVKGPEKKTASGKSAEGK
jgi:hypothetical protein